MQPVRPEDLPAIKSLIENAACKNASFAFVRDKDESLNGFVRLADTETTVQFSEVILVFTE